MKPVRYKGFILEVTKYEGWAMGSAFRSKDGWELADECVEGMTLKDMLADMKSYVDDYHKNPEDFED